MSYCFRVIEADTCRWASLFSIKKLNGSLMIKNNRIGLRIVIPVILGIMFAFGDDASNSEGKILTLKPPSFTKLYFSACFLCFFLLLLTQQWKR